MRTNKMYLEHANITVTDIKESIRFFKTAFPHFRIRGGGNGRREWVHLGDDHTYIAINQAKDLNGRFLKNYEKIGINHIGFVVEDVEEIASNLIKNGFKRDYPKQIETYRIRDYFADADGNEFEFVQYLSEKPAERNRYESTAL